MRYRVVEKADGLYYAQFFVWPWRWVDSCHLPNADPKKVIAFAQDAMRGDRGGLRRIARIIWPETRPISR